MDFPAAYAAALRFGRAPAESIREFAKQSAETGNHDPNSNSDHAFADFLEDHDDPRHLIVRRDLEVRGQPGAGWNVKSNHDYEAKLETAPHTPQHGYQRRYRQFDLDDGSRLGVSPRTENGKSVYHVNWTTNGTPYAGHFHHHEVQALLESLGLPADLDQFKLA